MCPTRKETTLVFGKIRRFFYLQTLRLDRHLIKLLLTVELTGVDWDLQRLEVLLHELQRSVGGVSSCSVIQKNGLRLVEAYLRL